METEKTRYSDKELEEFRTIINEKLALAKRDYDQMMAVITNQDSNDVTHVQGTGGGIGHTVEGRDYHDGCPPAEVHPGTEGCAGAH